MCSPRRAVAIFQIRCWRIVRRQHVGTTWDTQWVSKFHGQYRRREIRGFKPQVSPSAEQVGPNEHLTICILGNQACGADVKIDRLAGGIRSSYVVSFHNSESEEK